MTFASLTSECSQGSQPYTRFKTINLPRGTDSSPSKVSPFLSCLSSSSRGILVPKPRVFSGSEACGTRNSDAVACHLNDKAFDPHQDTPPRGNTTRRRARTATPGAKMMADSGDRVEDHVEAFDSQEPQATKEDKPQQSPGGDPIHNDEAHLDPSRWWFASSAFPLIAGTLGPVANAFSICALVRPWRQKFPPGSDLDKAQFVTDPVWCVGLFTMSRSDKQMLTYLSGSPS